MKKILALILALVMVFALVACGSGEKTPSGNEPKDDPNQTWELKMAMTSTSMKFASDYADLVSEATNGRVTVTIVDSASLGGAADALKFTRKLDFSASEQKFDSVFK